MWQRNTYIAAAAVLTIGCASSPPLVVLEADPADQTALVGEWHGEYGSSATGRHGSILFVLNAAGDSAVGEVLMVPAGYTAPRTAAEASEQIRRPIPQVLSIAFVYAQDGNLTGQLAPYRDPGCGCPVNTVFSGRFTGPATIAGTFVITGPAQHGTQTGDWSVRRVRARP